MMRLHGNARFSESLAKWQAFFQCRSKARARDTHPELTFRLTRSRLGSAPTASVWVQTESKSSQVPVNPLRS
jgi:hypothetical protein